MTQWYAIKIDCAEQCDVPAGKVMTKVPTSRHAWTDIMTCPHCKQSFLIRGADEVNADGQAAKDGT